MNYKAMAKAIRAERRAIWEELGKPCPPVFMVKGRQCGYYPPVSMTKHIPWSDLWFEHQMIEYTKMFWSNPYRVDWSKRPDTRINGLLAQMTTLP